MDDYLYDKETGKIWNLTKHRWVDDYSTEVWGHPNYQYGELTGTYFYTKQAEKYEKFGSGSGRGRNYYNAAGNLNFVGGRTWVGENGPEEVELPAGTRIYNAQETAQRSSGDVFIFNIDAKNVRELNQLLDMAKSARLERRMR